MHSLLNSFRKRWYTRRMTSARAAREWSGQYREARDGMQVIACRRCPKFSAAAASCTVPFGSPLRKCVSASQEANLHSLKGLDVLEIGYGKHSIPRRLVESAGGRWTGIEPLTDRARVATLGGEGFGHVTDIPFPDATFDMVVGIQTLEHWAEPLPDPTLAVGHAHSLVEVARVLKPGGTLYLDAPIHLHGHEMFIAGDMPRIRALFAAGPWADVTFESWRAERDPLPRYPTPAPDLARWPTSVTSYAAATLAALEREASVWLLTVRAQRR